MNTGTNLVITLVVLEDGIRDIDATIIAVTEKAVKVENASGWAWFPKSALKNVTVEKFFTRCDLAKWFDVSDFQFKMSEFSDITSMARGM